jgi:hypothetical protein
MVVRRSLASARARETALTLATGGVGAGVRFRTRWAFSLVTLNMSSIASPGRVLVI